MILILVEENSPRIDYIFNVVFKHILKVNYCTTLDIEEYKAYTNIKFSYGKTKKADGLFFGAHPIMFEDSVNKKYLEPIEWNNIKGFFQIKDLGFLPFDIFASSFYLISRYEEYISIEKDKYNRYKPELSILYTYNLLDKPLVNIYAQEIKKILLSFYPSYEFPKTKAEFKVTFDIDNAYCYKNKGFIRPLVSTFEDLIRFRFKNIIERIAVITNLQQDPYDTYNKQIEINDKYGIKPLYFFLLANFGGHDKNISHLNFAYKNLIKKMDEKYEVAFHPSYSSTKSEKILATEKNRIERILNKNISKSRQYFNKITLPDTYRKLVEIGITDDYSMGYNSVVGFRASICTPFPFYDLNLEKELPIIVHPFCMTDKMFKLHLRIRSSEVVYHARQIWDTIKSLDGEFTIIMHNEALGSKKMWRNWQSIYEEIIKMIIE